MEAIITVMGVMRGVVKSGVTPKWGLSVGYNRVYYPNGGDRVYLVPLYISQYVIINVFQAVKPYLGVTTKVTTPSGYRGYYSHADTRPPPI
jgi:hypothetical protein